MAEHEDRVVIGRVWAPPAFPFLVGPRAALRAEHVSAHDGGADIVVRMDEEIVVEALCTALLTGHLGAVLGCKGPLHQAQSRSQLSRNEALAPINEDIRHAAKRLKQRGFETYASAADASWRQRSIASTRATC